LISHARLYGLASVLIFAGVLVACLWPFQSPRNQVAWTQDGNGVVFGEYGTITSQGAMTWSSDAAPPGWTIELWIEPQNGWESNTILACYDPHRPQGLSVHETNGDLLVEDTPWNQADTVAWPKLTAVRILQHNESLFLTLTSGPEGTQAYVDGKLVASSPRLQVPVTELQGQAVVANSPIDSDSWAGVFRGLAIYNRELTETQVLQYALTWKQNGTPNTAQQRGAVALYLFNEHSGNLIHNQAPNGVDLYIPDRFLEVHQSFLKRPWNEYYPGWSYWESVLYNIGGFVPLGFLLYAYLYLGVHFRRSALITILAGGCLSLTIETLQSFLPTRDSGLTDVITNTIGTAVGVGLCHYTTMVGGWLTNAPFPALRYVGGLLSRELPQAEETRPHRSAH
jgi:VanZ family protein